MLSRSCVPATAMVAVRAVVVYQDDVQGARIILVNERCDRPAHYRLLIARWNHRDHGFCGRGELRNRRHADTPETAADEEQIDPDPERSRTN